MLGRPLDATDPIPRSALQIHDRENADFVFGHGVKKSVRKPLAQSTPSRIKYDRPRFRMLNERFGAATNFREEGYAKPELLVFVVLDRVVQFVLSQFVECSVHRSDPATSLAEDLGGCTT